MTLLAASCVRCALSPFTVNISYYCFVAEKGGNEKFVHSCQQRLARVDIPVRQSYETGRANKHDAEQ